MEIRLVQHFLEASAHRTPDKTALVCDDRRWTYREVDHLSNQVASALRSLGVRRGDRVVLCLRNSIEAVASIFGILKAGAVFVFVNATTKREKLHFILGNSGATALIGERRNATAEIAKGWRPRNDAPGLPRLLGWMECGSAVEMDAVCHPDTLKRISWSEVTALPGLEIADSGRTIDLDLACLIYTSGTTGEPKGVMSPHACMVFASGSIIEYLGMHSEDIIYNVLPLSFDYGLYQLLMTFRVGGTLILENSFAYPAAVLKTLAQERVTGFPGVPTLFEILLRMDWGSVDLSALRFLTNTAAALPASRVLELQERFPRARVFSMYGLTETKRTLYLPPEKLREKPGSVGIPIPGTEAWVEDESGRRLGPWEVGELVVRGRHVMLGYWQCPDASAKRFRPGTLPGERVCLTGDLFRVDEEGFFYFVARKDDVIKSRGEKVAPKEVEAVLYALPAIREAAVIGVPDPILGHAIKALVVSEDPALTAQNVVAHCRAHLEDFMVPKIVEFRESLPKTDSGKIARKELV